MCDHCLKRDSMYSINQKYRRCCTEENCGEYNTCRGAEGVKSIKLRRFSGRIRQLADWPLSARRSKSQMKNVCHMCPEAIHLFETHRV